jgi:hypothetical protein
MLHHFHRLRSRHLLKTCSTKHGSALRWFEGNGCFQATLIAGCARLGTRSLRSTGAFRLALLAVFRIVRKLFVLEKKLLARCKHKLGSAIHARQLSVNEVHEHSRQSCRLLRGCAGVLRIPHTRKPLVSERLRARSAKRAQRAVTLSCHGGVYCDTCHVVWTTRRRKAAFCSL